MIEPKFKLGQTVWMWHGASNLDGTVLHIFDADHPMTSGLSPSLPIYVIGYEVPGLGEWMYETREQHFVHEFEHCNGWNWQHVCKPNPDKVLNELKKQLGFAEVTQRKAERDVQRAIEDITKLTTQIQLLTTETPEPPVP